jgi:Caspase domain
MSKKIYALLVGINKYADAPKPEDTPRELTGCLNDIQAFREYLENKSKREGMELHPKELLDREATRDAVIRGFHEHLCQAKSNDIVLFYYSGHGSREEVSPELREFLNLDADLSPILLETLICWDSRTENGYDLADKELAILIAKVSRNRPQIVIILDCCHSGGLVRNNSVGRSFPSKTVDRPLSSFIFGSEQIDELFSSTSLDRTKVDWLTGLQSEYILLAACRSDELAREDRQRNRGVFSYFLTDSLQRTISQVSYRDIFNRTNVLVKTSYANQSPQITATNSDYLDRQFLGKNTTKQHHYFTISYRVNYGWVIDGGLVHGIKSNSKTEKTKLAVFPLDIDDLRQLKLAIATAELIEVLPQLSTLNIVGEKEPLNRELTYKAVVTSIPLSPLGVYLDGDKAEIDLARQAMRTASIGEQPSLYLCEAIEPAADFYLHARDSQYNINRPDKDRPEITTDSPDTAIQCLEHIARWKNIATLASPPNSRIAANEVGLQIYQEDGLEIKEPQIRLEYKYINGEWKPPAFRVKLTNNSREKLYFTLLDLTELYAIKAIPLNGNLVCCVEAGKSVWALDGNLIDACIPNEILQQDTIEYQDILKLICNTSDFEACLLEQNSIANGVNLSRQGFSQAQTIAGKSTLDRLMRRSQTRAIEASIETESICDDWVTSEVLITTVRAIIPVEDRCENLGDSVGKTLDRSTKQVFGSSSIKPQKFNLLAIVSIGSILCLIAIFSFLIWNSQKEERSKDRVIDRPIMRSPIINL